MAVKRSIPIVLLLIVVFSNLCFGSESEHKKYLKHIRTTTDERTQAAAALDIIYRTIPDYAVYFRVQINFSLPTNYYEVSANVQSTGTVDILASSGVAATRGFYEYIRKVHNGQVAWEGKRIEIESMDVSYNQTEQADSDVVYFQNVCTFSYTYAWWKFEDWRRHIDWIAMHGINLVLAPFQEDVWLELYREVGMNDTQIKDHFTGPAFLAWSRMGNLRGWGGPLNESFIEYSSELQQKVIREYQRLGINFALPSFAGHVPVTFEDLYPNTKFQRASGWNNFSESNCCPLFIDPIDPLFHEIGTKFLNKTIEKYGTSHIYFADPFNELVPHTNDPNYLANVSRAIYGVMTAVDPDSIWLLQGWMFYYEADFWKAPQIEAFLTAVPIGKILVLDLHSDMFPQYERTNSYYGQPFIWNMLHNFGGNLGLRGSAGLIAARARETFNDPEMTMVGMGITPEGINQNHVIYEFALDLAWIGKEPFRSSEWFIAYGKNRYGPRASSGYLWKDLHDTIYNYNGTKRIDGSSPYLVVDSPSLNHKPWSWFHPDKIKSIVGQFLNISGTSGDLVNYDIIDFTRQYLQNMIDLQYLLIMDGYENGSLEKVEFHVKIFLDMILKMDELLSCNENFLLGRWLSAALSIPGSHSSNRYNALNQITLWGPNGEISNYAMKQWAGLMKDYVHPRWKLFWAELQDSMYEGKIFDESAVRQKIFTRVEEPFNMANNDYPTVSSCSGYSTAINVFRKFEKLHIDQYNLDKYLNENAAY